MARPTVQFSDDTRSADEWFAAAEELSQRVVHTDARTAYARICEGKYEGTPFAGKLSQLMFLAGEDMPVPRAAE